MNVAQRLIAHFKTAAEAAEAFRVSRETIRLWRINGIPLSRSLDVEKATGGEVTADEVVSEARAKGEGR